MKIEKYFEKNGEIYGVSRVNNQADEIFRFDNLNNAYKWLNRETYRFAERELCSRTAAEKAENDFCGIIDFENYICNNDCYIDSGFEF